jgi:hypothetical protein
MTLLAILGGALVGALIGRITFPLFFADAAEFRECVKFSFTPDLISLWRRRYGRDVAKSLKLSAWCVLCLLAAYGSGTSFATWLRP